MIGDTEVPKSGEGFVVTIPMSPREEGATGRFGLPKKLPHPQFRMPSKFLLPFKAKPMLEKVPNYMQLLAKQTSFNLSNRSDVGLAFDSLCVNLERRIREQHLAGTRRKSTSDDVRSRLRAMDANGNGWIDKTELLRG
jgi:hypothetical protein